ncbi:MAG TPA: PQQ-dependent dehydrogenase, methanol/ethanol family [Vicinamibacterales bacterium]|nr:PQQ-dependent dehydrogenase, methanol/ethanol family [Vicinamibacterales bacterium]
MKISFLAVALLAVAGMAQAQTQQDLNRDGNVGSTDNVLTYGMGYHQQRFSKLDQINKKTVKRLVPVWSASLNADTGEQGQPLVHNGVLYAANARRVVAIDVGTGRHLWNYDIQWEPAVTRVVCCGLNNRGVAIFDGKVYVSSLDAHMYALDAKTGKQLWKSKIAEWKEGYSITSAPSVVNGVVMSGMAGGELGVRGFVVGLDAQTGTEIWRRHTTPDPHEKAYATWPNDDSYKHGGASTWITGSYDPELDLSYWGTGNGGPWTWKARPGDNLWVASVIAIRPKTGEIVWHYQWTPADTYDYDGNNENVLGDITVNGKKRKVLMHADRNGLMYVLDRATGEVLAGNPYVTTNWTTGVDLKTGRPIETDVAKRLRAGEQVELQPRWAGGKNWMPMAFNPKTGRLYLSMLEETAIYQLNKDLPVYKAGERYMGATFTTKERDKSAPWGYIGAVDPMTGKSAWRLPLVEFPSWSGKLVTAGGLVFSGLPTGEFMALDESNGKVLWKFKTSSAINAQPITYTYKGKQYVSVLSGLGGGTSSRRETAGKVLPGGTVWTFALMD